MSTEAAFWNGVAAKYAKRPVGNPTAYAETLSDVIGRLSPRDRVLELGCGTGTTALKLAPHVKTITGTDISGEMIAIAERKRQEGSVVNAGFATAGITAPDADVLPYDAVLAFNLLHLVEDLDGALAAIFAQVRPGGLFISKSACIGGMNRLFRPMIRAMQLIGKAPYVNVFRKPELEAAIARAGFVLEASRTFTDAPHSQYVVARRPG